MPTPLGEELQITFLGVEPSASIEGRIRERVARLERFAEHIIGLRVTVDVPHQQHRKGTLFSVRLDLRARNEELAVSRVHRHDHAHEDVFTAIRDAFDALTRQLDEHIQRQRDGAKANGRADETAARSLLPDERRQTVGDQRMEREAGR